MNIRLTTTMRWWKVGLGCCQHQHDMIKDAKSPDAKRFKVTSLAKQDMMMMRISAWQRIFLQFESLRLKAAKHDQIHRGNLEKKQGTCYQGFSPSATTDRSRWFHRWPNGLKHQFFFWTQTWDGTVIHSSRPWIMLYYFHLGLCSTIYIQGHTIRVSMKQSNKKKFHGVKTGGK